MSRFRTICTAAALIFVSGSANAQDFTAFGSCPTSGVAGSIPLVTKNADILVVGTILPAPGSWNGMTPERISDGFEYCIAAEIAHRAGVHKLIVKNMAWDQFISGSAVDYDIAMAGVTITEPRKQIFNFSRPYFSSNLGVAIKTGADVTPENIQSKRVGVVQGNTAGDWVRNKLDPATDPAVFQTFSDMMTALLAGQIDAVINDTYGALLATHQSNGVLTVVGQYTLGQGYGVVTPKASPNAAAVDQAVGELVSNGALEKLADMYLAPMFGISPSAVPMWALK